MANLETGWSSFCRSWAPSTYFVLMTSSLISNLIGLSAAQTDLANYTISSNQTEDSNCLPCPVSDDSGTSTGVIIGSAIAGAIVGCLITAAVMTYLRNRSLAPLPKDYDGIGEQMGFDVNRNDDVILTNGGDVEEGDPAANKAHKKLERLVQRNPYQTPGPEMAAVPLIHNTDASSDVTNDRKTPQGKTQKQNPAGPAAANSNKPKPNEKPSSLSCPVSKPDGEKEEEEAGEDRDYLNVGEKSALEQPYDSLAMVPEEVEYENHKENVYEPILQDEGNKNKNTSKA